jgi:hypothetical protein
VKPSAADTQERNRLNRRDGQPEDVDQDEAEIDRILADSFPASDAPPWTLGIAPSAPTRAEHLKGTKADR